ncbi:PAS domain-containing protein [Piscinibacter sakaiensis]|uniref:PAS domain-containing protein n=1 Tax=Piscinibacter sakaiensis TaxID=1547922 RepID=UPI003AABBDD3
MGNDHQPSATPDDRFQILFEQAPFSVQLLATDGRTLQVNRAWQELWQVEGNSELMRYVLSEYNVLTDPQLAAKGITGYFQRAFAGESVEMPAIVYDPAEIGKPGIARWVKAHAHPVRDASGAVREVMLIHEDVSAEMRTRKALEASEQRLKQLANTIPQMAWMAHPDGNIHWFNERWFAYTGSTIEQMQDDGWKAVHDPAVLPEVVERWQQSLHSGEPFQMTFPLRGSDGRFRPFFTLVAPLKDESGAVVQWFGTNTDVSALHEAERSLRQTEERLRLAIRAGSIGIWEWDVITNRVEWTDEVYRLHGLEPGTFGGRAEDFSALVHPEDRGALWQKIEAALAGEGDFSAEFRIVMPDQRLQWLSTWAQVARDAAGKITHMVGATISIDAYKRAEQALRDGDRRKDEFLAMLAHELRNPLAAIGAASQLLELRVGNQQQTQRASEVILRQVRHMTELVDDLLDVSRVMHGLVEFERHDVDLRTIIDHAVEQARPAIDAKAHQLTIRIADEPVLVSGDATRLIQAVVNLLNNAARYTQRGGSISLGLQVDETGQVEVSVDDNGPGIDEHLLPHLFELFAQGKRAAGRAEGGLGIGLVLVKRIAELHGGRVVATSRGTGSGSRFVLTLPRLDATAQVSRVEPAAAAAAGPGGDTLRILLVDDNRDAADMLAVLLSSAGHEVGVAHDGRSALDAASRDDWEVCVLDIGLPDIDGHELARLLRDRLPSATYIALTGYGQPEDIARTRAAGFNHHLVKPVETATLLALLRQARAAG